MKIQNVTKAEKRKEDRVIEHYITDPISGEETKKQYVAVRGGISWPTAIMPACFCIVGQEFLDPLGPPIVKGTKGKRIILVEYVQEKGSGLPNMDTFYKELTDRAAQMLCTSFYTVVPEQREDCGFLKDIGKYAVEKKVKMSVCEALDAKNFLLGVSRIKSDIDRGELIIPKDSAVMTELKTITEIDLNEKPEERFYAINALRHVIGSYYRHKPSERQSRKRQPPVDWRYA